jgi:YggT family protein
MFILGNFIDGLAKVLDIALNLYMWVIIIRALISWVNPDPYNPIVQFLYRITEPVLYPVRKRLPLRNLGIDFSPVVVLLVIVFLQVFLIQSLHQLAFAIKSTP